MKTFQYEITDPIGIHARPAGQLVKTAKAFQSKVMVEYNGKQTEATRLMSVMGMGIRRGGGEGQGNNGNQQRGQEAAAQQLQAFFRETL